MIKVSSMAAAASATQIYLCFYNLTLGCEAENSRIECGFITWHCTIYRSCHNARVSHRLIKKYSGASHENLISLIHVWPVCRTQTMHVDQEPSCIDLCSQITEV